VKTPDEEPQVDINVREYRVADYYENDLGFPAINLNKGFKGVSEETLIILVRHKDGKYVERGASIDETVCLLTVSSKFSDFQCASGYCVC
jgi:hypothetical protein